MEKPYIITGGRHKDHRGEITFNNTFDVSAIKRMYTITNTIKNPTRGWQGHKIESRWFSCIRGSFNISLIAIDNWDVPSKDLKTHEFIITAETLDVLYTPPGFISCLEMLEKGAILLTMANYELGEVQDEYRFDLDYFN